MQNWPWWTYSIFASLLWGLHFNLVVKVSSVLPKDIYAPLTLFFITANSIWLILLLAPKRIFGNLEILWAAGPQIRLSVLVLMFTTLVAACFLTAAMQLSNNATLASLLDITYPIFVALFAWWLFKEGNFDWSMLLGGLLIFSGSLLIIWKHG